MSSKLRVYEVARDLGMDNKELVTLLQSIGFSEIKNHMSVVPSEAIDRAKRQIERKNEPSKVVEERIRPTVVKRRSAVKRPEDGAGAESGSTLAAPPVPPQATSHPTSEPRVAAAPPASDAKATSVKTVDALEPELTAAKADVPTTAASSEAQPSASDKTPRAAADVAGAGPADTHGPTPEASANSSTPVASATTTTVATKPEGSVTKETPGASSIGEATPSRVDVPQSGGNAESKAETSASASALTHGEKTVGAADAAASASSPAKAEALQPQERVADAPQAQETKQGEGVHQPLTSEGSPVQVAPAKAEEAKRPPSTGLVEGTRPEAPRTSDVAALKPVAGVQPRPAGAPADRPPVGTTPGAAPVASAPTRIYHAANARPGAQPSTGQRVMTSSAPGSRPSTPPGAPSTASRPSSPPRTGIEVWEGRPGVPMSPAHRAPVPRRVQYDAKAGANAMQRRPGQPAQRMARGTRGKGPAMGPGGSMGRGPMGRPSNAPPATQERGAHKRVVKIEGSIGLQTLAGRMGIKAHELLRKLIMLGMTGVNINSTLDADTAKIVASEFGWEVEDVAVSEEQALVIAQGVETEAESGEREPRPPVVTVMGHVDHGKTSLLDRIRKANVAAGEAGGITQHIGAYSVDTARGRITFLDTPGHAAFTAMRARGAQTTDIVILVVAADDGVMPQTREAVAHAKAAKVPIVVAINKCDKPEAQPDRCRRELAELGLVPEEWGGEALYAEVSAHTGKGVDELLERVLLQAEMLDLRANPNKLAVGVVIEAQLDRGRGPVATMLVTDGTLKRGDILLVGAASGKVRALLDSTGRSLAEAGPSTPVEVIGLNDVPAAGDPVHVVKDIKKAQELADSRKIKERRSLMPSGGQRLTLEELYKAMKETEQLELKVIVKADVHGSVEAVSDALVRLSTEKVKVTVVHSAAGAITEGDVNLAVAAGAIIIGFNVRPAGKAAALASQEKIEVRQYNIIYNVVDDVKAAMEGLLSPSLVEKVLGQAQVRQVFRVSKAGNVAGCMVTQGLIRRGAGIRVMRDGTAIWSGKMSALKRFKDDAREVKEGFDCGISLDGYQDIKEGDILECFEMEEVRQTL